MDRDRDVNLILENGYEFKGFSFGAEHSVSGEIVFSTGMVGYPESLTDPSYKGQILVLTYPLIGNYGVPGKDIENNLLRNFESDKIQVAGLIVSNYIDTPSHHENIKTLAKWFKDEKGKGIDTSVLTQEELFERIRKTRNDIWEEKYEGWFERLEK